MTWPWYILPQSCGLANRRQFFLLNGTWLLFVPVVGKESHHIRDLQFFNDLVFIGHMDGGNRCRHITEAIMLFSSPLSASAVPTESPSATATPAGTPAQTNTDNITGTPFGALVGSSSGTLLAYGKPNRLVIV